MRILHAPGLTLEPQTAAHAQAMFELLDDAQLYTYLDDSPPPSAAALRERFKRLESRRSTDGREAWLNWAIRLDSGELAGFVQATCSAELAWVAYVLGRRFWGHGIAQRATQAMLDELGSHYGVTGYFASADRANQRSIRLLQRLGFVSASEQQRTQQRTAESDVLMALQPDGAR
jgi:RimJ/RimL family protein N-acetyltransferase